MPPLFGIIEPYFFKKDDEMMIIANFIFAENARATQHTKLRTYVETSSVNILFQVPKKSIGRLDRAN